MRRLKKICAILILCILLFNIIGYRFLLNYLEAASNEAVVAKLDRQEYNDYELVTITVPLNLPYETDWKDFERLDGTVTLQGKSYRYVKRKIYHGQLVLLCLPDESARRFDTAKDEFFKIANDLTGDNAGGKGASNMSGKALSNVFEQPAVFRLAVVASLLPVKFRLTNVHARSVFTPGINGKPPQSAC